MITPRCVGTTRTTTIRHTSHGIEHEKYETNYFRQNAQKIKGLAKIDEYCVVHTGETC